MAAFQKDVPDFAVDRHPRCQKLLGDNNPVRLLVVDIQTQVDVPELLVLFFQFPGDRCLLRDIRGGQLDIRSSVHVEGFIRQLPHGGAVGQRELRRRSCRSRGLPESGKIGQRLPGQSAGERVGGKIAEYDRSLRFPKSDPRRKQIHRFLDAFKGRVLLSVTE